MVRPRFGAIASHQLFVVRRRLRVVTVSPAPRFSCPGPRVLRTRAAGKEEERGEPDAGDTAVVHHGV